MPIPCQATLGNVEGVETRTYNLEQIMKSVRWKWLPLEAPNAFNNLIINYLEVIYMGYIYGIQNQINNKWYVGQSIYYPKERWR